jgi:hypothetical protein
LSFLDKGRTDMTTSLHTKSKRVEFGMPFSLSSRASPGSAGFSGILERGRIDSSLIWTTLPTRGWDVLCRPTTTIQCIWGTGVRGMNIIGWGKKGAKEKDG